MRCGVKACSEAHDHHSVSPFLNGQRDSAGAGEALCYYATVLAKELLRCHTKTRVCQSRLCLKSLTLPRINAAPLRFRSMVSI